MTKRMKIGIATILDAWNAEVDIDGYGIDKDGRLRIEYYVTDDKDVALIEARWVAEWFGGRFVEWVWDDKPSLDGMVIEKEVAE